MEWGYTGVNGPEKWHQLFSAATGQHQSPIDIDLCSVAMDPTFSNKKLKWQYYPDDMSTLLNTGHSWQVQVDSGLSEISDGPLSSNYELAQVHAHWGANDDEGSEHTINGKQYAGELHLVHWNKTNYSTIEEATKHPDGLCVIGVLLQLGDTHQELRKIVDHIPEIVHKGDACKMATPLNPKLLLPNNLNYWTYMGSLTTPPCLECVVWIVFNEPVEISQQQLEAFRTLRCHTADNCNINTCGDQMKLNYRPTVALGDRVIRYCGP